MKQAHSLFNFDDCLCLFFQNCINTLQTGRQVQLFCNLKILKRAP